MHEASVRNTLQVLGIALAILLVAPPAFARPQLPRQPDRPTFARSNASASVAPPAAFATPAPTRPVTTGVPDGAGGWFSVWYEVRNSGADEGFFLYEVFLQRYTGEGAVAPGWPAHGLPVLDVANDGDLMPRLVADGAGGVIVAWDDYTTGWPMPRAQRVSAAGERLWGASGVALATGLSYRSLDAIAPDGAGGLFAAWFDQGPLLETGSGLYVQHVTSGGTLALGWPAAGVLMSSLDGWHALSTLSPSASGVVVVWSHEDEFGGNEVVRFQRLDSAGGKQLAPDGLVLTQVNANDFHCISDDAGGVIVAWNRLNGSQRQIWARRFDPDAQGMWAPEGNLVCAGTSFQTFPVMAEDGAGGAIVTWNDSRGGSQVFAQRLLASGALAAGWPSSGVQVHDRGPGPPLIVPDAIGGAHFVWRDPGVVGYTIRARHLAADGSSAWPISGVLLSGPDEAAEFFGVNAAPGPAGSLFVDWMDHRGSEWSIARFAHRVDADGSLEWDAAGLRLTSEEASQRLPSLDADGSGSASIVWQEKRAGSWDVRGRFLSPAGDPLSSSFAIGVEADDQVVPRARIGGGGASFALWKDERASYSRLHAQRFDMAGAISWPDSGIALSEGINRVDGYRLCRDGADGAFVMWGEDGNLHVQRMGASPTPQWPIGGVVVESLARVLDAELHPDGSGGALATWTEIVDNWFGFPVDFNLRAQRVSAAGSKLWTPEGVLVRAIAPPSPYLLSAPDGTGGVFLVSAEGDRFLDSVKIVVNHVTAAGAVDASWPAGGVTLSLPFSRKFLTAVSSDSAGGMVIGWEDARGGEGFKAYAQRVNAAGVVQWNAAGLALADAPGTQWLMGLVPSGGGVIAAILDGRGASWDVYAQRADAAGTLPWGASGIAVCSAPGTQQDIRIVSDGSNGAIFAWQDERDLTRDEIRAARVTVDGALPWSTDGIVSTLASLVSATLRGGEARILWQVAPQRRVLVQRADAGGWITLAEQPADGSGRVEFVDRGLTPGRRHGWRLLLDRSDGPAAGEVWLESAGTGRLAILALTPNPSSDDLRASIEVPSRAPVTLSILDVAGRSVWSHDAGALDPGRHDLQLAAPPGTRPGLYFLRITHGGATAIARFARLR